MMKSKLAKVRERRYVQGISDIRSLISFFVVPKGKDDVRMVYDGTKSGLMTAFGSLGFSCLPSEHISGQLKQGP